jgi:hypothetical protein
MGWLQRPRAARRAATGGYPRAIQGDEQAIRRHASEAEVRVSWQPLGGVPRQRSVGNRLQHGANELVAQGGLTLSFSGTHVLRNPHRLREADDARDILRTCAAVAFLPAADHQRLQRGHRPHIERADTIGSVHLVRRDAQ